jgi:hypothetical protein
VSSAQDFSDQVQLSSAQLRKFFQIYNSAPETQSDGSLDSDEHEYTKVRDKNEKLLAGKM